MIFPPPLSEYTLFLQKKKMACEDTCAEIVKLDSIILSITIVIFFACFIIFYFTITLLSEIKKLREFIVFQPPIKSPIYDPHYVYTRVREEIDLNATLCDEQLPEKDKDQ